MSLIRRLAGLLDQVANPCTVCSGHNSTVDLPPSTGQKIRNSLSTVRYREKTDWVNGLTARVLDDHIMRCGNTSETVRYNVISSVPKFRPPFLFQYVSFKLIQSLSILVIIGQQLGMYGE